MSYDKNYERDYNEEYERDTLAQFQYWSDYEKYLADICRTLYQTGEVFVKKEDVCAVSSRLRESGILPEAWKLEPVIDDWFLVLTNA